VNAPLAAAMTLPPAPPTTARLVAFLFLLLALAVGVVAITDELGAPGASRVDRGAAPVRRAGASRAFVFVIDSLAYEAATDPSLMPNLVALQATSAFGKVQASRDAVTTPALRAAFTGQDSFRVLGFVRNFVSGERALDSLFGDARRAGMRSAAWSDGAFAQFAGEIDALRPNEAGEAGLGEIERQIQAGEDALRAFLAGEFDLVALHVTFTDHAAHTKASRPERFREAFAAADRFVGRLAASIPREDVLLVMGDHGHNATGNHSLGLDVPTYASYRGPGYAPHVDFAPAFMTDHRYLLGFGLGLGLPQGYQGRAHPEALRSADPLPPAYAAVSPAEAAPMVPPLAPYLLLAAATGALGAGCIAFLGRGRLGLRRLAAGAATGVVLLGWGHLLAWARPLVHEPGLLKVEAAWGAAVLLAVAVGRARGPRTGAWLILGAGALLLYPSVYHYGAMASMVPAWVVFLVLVVGTPGERGWGRFLARAAVAAFVFLLIQPFLIPESYSFHFDHWNPLSLDLAPASDRAWFATALVAKAILAGIVACAGRRTPLRAGVALAVAAGIAYVEETPSAATSPAVLGLAVVLWIAARRASWAGGLARLAAALLATVWLIRVPVSFHRSFDCLAAALAMTGLLVPAMREEDRRSHHVFLLCLGTLAAGWCTLAFGADRLEWQALYDAFAPPVVERHVALFLPIIAGRFALAMVVVRLALRPALPTEPTAAEGGALVLVGVSVLSLLCVGLGLARALPGSSVYLESCQHAAVLWMVALGFAVPLRDEARIERASAVPCPRTAPVVVR